MNRKIVTVALVAAMALTLTGLAWADEGSAKPEGQRAGYLKQGIMQQLTPEQREELRSTIAEMLKGWGIKAPPLGAGPLWGQQAAPSRWGQRGMGMMQQGHRGMGMMQQRGQQAGPPRWGQQAAPPRWGQQAGAPRWGQQAGPPRWGQPAPPPYWGWGQKAPPPQRGQLGPPLGWGHAAPPPRAADDYIQRLTPEQREQVKAKITELHEDGASAQEIREALGDMLEGWGIQLPPQSRD